MLNFIYISENFDGELISETSEGKVYWINESEIKEKKLADDFNKLLEVFNDEKINEMIYDDNENSNEDDRWNLELY